MAKTGRRLGTGIFEDPTKREMIYKSLIETGTQTSGCRLVGVHYNTWLAWKKDNKEVAEKELNEAYLRREGKPATNDVIAEVWKGDKELTESYLQYLIECVMRGYTIDTEVNVIETPVRDDEGEFVLDDEGEIVYEPEKRFTKTFHRSLGKYHHEMFQKLIRGQSGVPTADQLTTFTFNFLTYLQKQSDLDDVQFQEITTAAQNFEHQMKMKIMLAK